MGINAKSFSGLADFSTYYFKVEGKEYSVSTRKSPTYFEVANLINKAIQSQFKAEIIGKERDQDIIIYKQVGNKKRSVTIDRGTTGKDLFSSLLGWHGFKQEKTNSVFQPTFSFIATSPKIGFNKENISEVDRSYLASGLICLFGSFGMSLDFNIESLLSLKFAGKTEIEAYTIGPTSRKTSIKKKRPSRSLLGSVELKYLPIANPILICGTVEYFCIKNFDILSNFKLPTPSGSAKISLAGARRTSRRKTRLGPSGELESTDFSGLFDHTTYYFKVNNVEHSITTGSAPTFQDVANLLNNELIPDFDSFVLVDADGADIWIRNRYEPGYTGEVNLDHGDTSPDLFYSLAYWSGFRKPTVYGYSRGPEALIMNFTDIGGTINISGSAISMFGVNGLYIGSGILFGLGGSAYTIIFAFGNGAGGVVISGASLYTIEIAYVASGGIILSGIAATERYPIDISYYPDGIGIVISGTTINAVDRIISTSGSAILSYTADYYCTLYWHYHGGLISVTGTWEPWSIELLLDMVGSIAMLGGVALSEIELTAAATGGMTLSGTSIYINPSSDWIFVGDGTVELNSYYSSLGLDSVDDNLGLGLGGEPMTHYYSAGGMGALGGTADVRTVFTMTWKTDNAGGETNDDQIKLPLDSGGTYNFTVYWGDTSSSTIIAYNDPDITHTYASAGTYDIVIDGTCIGFGFASGDGTKLIDIKQWGRVVLHNNGSQFKNCINLECSATDSPDLSNITNMSSMFENCVLFNGNISNWNVSNVSDMSWMFDDCHIFNSDISNWDVSSVITIEGLFYDAYIFNQDIGGWDVSKVTNMRRALGASWRDYTIFNKDIGGWDVSKVTNMDGLFRYNNYFNQDLSSWDVSKVTNMNEILYDATAFTGDITGWVTSSLQIATWMFCDDDWTGGTFNQDLSGWDVGNVTDMRGMFAATAFNRDLSGWNISKVTDMSSMFEYSSFNGNIGGWDVSGVIYMQYMFASATKFNQDISGWDVSNVISFANMFQYATAFVQDITGWITSSATSMAGMFQGATSFNQDISSWDVSKVTNMSNMFSGTSFNQDISEWDVSKVEYFHNMFAVNTKFNQDIGGWVTSSAIGMTNMFRDATAFNQNINGWDVSNVVTIYDMFYGATAFNQSLNSWDTSKVNSFYSMFKGATSFNGNISNWNFDSCVNIGYMFDSATAFNQDISDWDVSNITNMEGTFKGANAFSYDISGWDVSAVTNMGYMFQSNTSFNQDISDWNVSKVTTFSNMFYGATAFNQPLNSWVTSSLTVMQYMFYGATAFNQPIGSWNVSKVTDISNMFYGAIAFNQDISGWDVSKVAYLDYTFKNATAFNKPLNSWITSSLVNMYGTFEGATKFNQPLDNWNVSKVTRMYHTFYGATAFNQNIGNWDIRAVSSPSQGFQEMFANATLSTSNYDALWNGWVLLPPASDHVFHGGASKYSSAGSASRNTLDTTYSWTITDGGAGNAFRWNYILGGGTLSGACSTAVDRATSTSGGCTLSGAASTYRTPILYTGDGPAILSGSSINAVDRIISTSGEATISGLATTVGLETFITSWRVAAGTGARAPSARKWITGNDPGAPNLNLHLDSGGTYNFTVWWGDGSSNVITAYNQPEATHQYTTGGTYEVLICGICEGFGFNGTTYTSKLLDVKQWGRVKLHNNGYQFAECNELTGFTATDELDISNITNMSYMFYNCYLFDADLSYWNVSAVTNMSYMFDYASVFNGNIVGWNTGNVTLMNNMFEGAAIFNRNIGSWDVSKVTNLAYMFSEATIFNQDISEWITSNVTDMTGLFALATAFNQNITGWNTSKVTTMQGTFAYATSFNQDITKWDTSNVTDMSNMFSGPTGFVIDLSGLDISAVTNMSYMLSRRTIAIPGVENWDVSKVQNMSWMFQQTDAFPNISSWVVSGVTNMEGMFFGVEIPIPDISGWSPSSCTSMKNLFRECTASFTQNLNGWDTSKVVDLQYAFYLSTVFNGDISGWDVSSVTNMFGTFSSATKFNQDISGWITTSLTSMNGTFSQATDFNQNIGNWDISKVTDMTTVFYNCTLSTSKYDAILNGWNAQVPKDGVHVHGGLSKYSSAGSAARAALIADHSWVFDGDGGAGNAFRWNYILGGGTLSGASTTSVDIIYTGLGGTTLSGIATTSVEV